MSSIINPDLINASFLIELIVGISLSVASGFRVFVPLLILSIVGVAGWFDFPPDFDWLETPQTLGLFAIASTLEIIGYSVPWVDNLLDTLSTPIAIIAGTLVTLSFTQGINPMLDWTLAIVAGGGAAGLTKGLMNLLRATSTATSGGLTNPVVAAMELIVATVMTLLALTLPILAAFLGVAVLGLALGIFAKLWTGLRRKKKRRTSDSFAEELRERSRERVRK
ncbi:MAG: DUF4126 domain-containing protein [Oculatellaceae cyanobacterium Prado106]|jgi:hypothetical protein|nr:DUF4126 domain-containing protein [Oculatellaceae cyanobacterium Prado106]